MLIVGEYVTERANDKKELGRITGSVDEEVYKVETVKKVEKREDSPEPATGATVREEMARRLKTDEGRKIYKKRKETGEPVFGIIKQAMGFRQFLLRGLAACRACGFFAFDAAKKSPRSRLLGIFVGEEIADLRSDYTFPREPVRGFLAPYPDPKIGVQLFSGGKISGASENQRFDGVWTRSSNAILTLMKPRDSPRENLFRMRNRTRDRSDILLPGYRVAGKRYREHLKTLVGFQMFHG
jgi:hypothetical protein